jgi:predicted DCC family thiol-disulfide oxidoreductase YuxK
MFAQLGFLRPVAFLMGVPGVRQVGERVYGYVAANRSRHFTCRPAGED